jgi:hypothetical protein
MSPLTKCKTRFVTSDSRIPIPHQAHPLSPCHKYPAKRPYPNSTPYPPLSSCQKCPAKRPYTFSTHYPGQNNNKPPALSKSYGRTPTPHQTHPLSSCQKYPAKRPYTFSTHYPGLINWPSPQKLTDSSFLQGRYSQRQTK